jgi:hypothetical protein
MDDATGNQWLELLVEFDSVRMRSNMVLVTIYEKVQNFKIFKIFQNDKINCFLKGY